MRLTCSPKGGNNLPYVFFVVVLFDNYLPERSSGYEFELFAKEILHIPVLLHRGVKFLITLP